MAGALILPFLSPADMPMRDTAGELSEFGLKPAAASLKALAEAEQACTRCPLYKNATQAVAGEGLRRARLMFVGEQPGDQEDRAGRPFVGPAGRVLDQALAEAGIARTDAFVTNAVKHFKHELRGKRRLHKRPNAYEIERCRIGADRVRARASRDHRGPRRDGRAQPVRPNCHQFEDAGGVPLSTMPS